LGVGVGVGGKTFRSGVGVGVGAGGGGVGGGGAGGAAICGTLAHSSAATTSVGWLRQFTESARATASPA
jgi:hypothetical protein